MEPIFHFLSLSFEFLTFFKLEKFFLENPPVDLLLEKKWPILLFINKRCMFLNEEKLPQNKIFYISKKLLLAPKNGFLLEIRVF